MSSLLQNFANEIQSISLMILIISALIHLIFAGAIARDAGLLNKRGQPTWLVSGFTWAFATLVGGVLVVAIYWLVHYSHFRQSK